MHTCVLTYAHERTAWLSSDSECRPLTSTHMMMRVHMCPLQGTMYTCKKRGESLGIFVVPSRLPIESLSRRIQVLQSLHAPPSNLLHLSVCASLHTPAPAACTDPQSCSWSRLFPDLLPFPHLGPVFLLLFFSCIPIFLRESPQWLPSPAC